MITFVKYSGLTRVHSENEYSVLTRVLFKLSVLSTYLNTDPQYLLHACCLVHKLALCTSQAAENIQPLKKHQQILTLTIKEIHSV